MQLYFLEAYLQMFQKYVMQVVFLYAAYGLLLFCFVKKYTSTYYNVCFISNLIKYNIPFYEFLKFSF